MTKEQFVRMMNAAEAFEQEVERWNDFGIELVELPISEIPWKMFDCWLESSFDEDGRDWISWYLFERRSIITNEILPCYDEDDNEFYVHTSEDLWELIEMHQLDYSVEEACDTKSDIA